MRKPRDLDIDLTGARILTTRITLPEPAPSARRLPAGVYELEIPGFRPATLNELFAAGNHFAAARRKRGDRELVMAYAAASGIPEATAKRRVSMVVTLSGRMKQCDPDAFWKSLLDALVQARMLVDDSPGWVEMGTVEQIGGDRKATRVILEDVK